MLAVVGRALLALVGFCNGPALVGIVLSVRLGQCSVMHPECSRASERGDLDLPAAVVAHEAREANTLLPPASARSQIEDHAPTPAALTGVKKNFRAGERPGG